MLIHFVWVNEPGYYNTADRHNLIDCIFNFLYTHFIMVSSLLFSSLWKEYESAKRLYNFFTVYFFIHWKFIVSSTQIRKQSNLSIDMVENRDTEGYIEIVFFWIYCFNCNQSTQSDFKKTLCIYVYLTL